MQLVPAVYEFLGGVETFLLIEKVYYPGEYRRINFCQEPGFTECRKPVARTTNLPCSGGAALFAAEHRLLHFRQKGHIDLLSHGLDFLGSGWYDMLSCVLH